MKKRALLLVIIAVILVGTLFVLRVVLKQSLKPDTPLQDVKLYVDPQSNPAKQATAWRTIAPENATLMDKLAALPSTQWITTPEHLPDLQRYIQAAARENAVPVVVAYYFPGRDCGQYSAGGAESETAYMDFIGRFAAAIGNSRAVVVVEPDAIVHINATNNQGQPCLPQEMQAGRYDLLQRAVSRLKQQPGTNVYLDAGNSAWLEDYNELAIRLRKAGIAQANGFSLNVSNFQTTAATTKYGEKLSQVLEGTHFIIDTSRNGLGPYTNKLFPTHSWCNPPGRALGHYPTTKTGHILIDAYLYIKNPGESDGQDPEPGKCFNGPKAGEWWPDYALELIQRWPDNLQP